MMEPDMRMEAGKRVHKSPRENPTLDVLALANVQLTLVKYDTPFLVAIHDTKKSGGDWRNDPQGEGLSTSTALVLSTTPGHCSSEDPLMKKETEEILNAIIPPREWKDENGSVWRQMVSTVPATRQDVINLEEVLNLRLKEMQARETGICPIRRELYAQCFDELIRQVTINCSERGILLLRVRDELNMTMGAYETLYESSTAYGMRKALMAESGKSELETKIVEMTIAKDELEVNVNELQSKIDEIETKYNEQKAAEEIKHSDEIQFLKKANQQIKQQLEAIVAPKKP